MTLCPCCAQPLPDLDDLVIDPAGIVVRWGRFATLTSQEFAVLETLFLAMPRVLSKEQILMAIYRVEQDEPEIKIIDVWVCKLRKKLKPLGLSIETAWGRDYRMLPVAARQEAA